MAAETKIKTACPVCGVKYKVNESTLGHRALCRKCGTKFRVAAYDAPLRRHPNEDDILRWLNEGRDEDDYAPPREYRDAGDARHFRVRGTSAPDNSLNPAASEDRTGSSETSPLSFRKLA